MPNYKKSLGTDDLSLKDFMPDTSNGHIATAGSSLETQDKKIDEIEIIDKLTYLNTLEDALLLLERFNKSIADKLLDNLSNTIERRSLAYVNRYTKTNMKIAAIIFDRKRKIRWSGIHGKDYVSYFQFD